MAKRAAGIPIALRGIVIGLALGGVGQSDSPPPLSVQSPLQATVLRRCSMLLQPAPPPLIFSGRVGSVAGVT